ncbi:hypothetical protein EB795_10190 [Pseudomonas mandelii]|nr:hypothetical protein [Pseudomonas mandelii]
MPRNWRRRVWRRSCSANLRGASLLAKVNFQIAQMLNVSPPSRAGSLPRLIFIDRETVRYSNTFG